MFREKLKESNMSFTSLAWEKSLPIIKEIYRHPFITELISGSLDKRCFSFYLQQDWMYLNDFSQALISTALLAPTNEEAACFIKLAHEVSLVEQNLHLTFLSSYNTPKEVKSTPACFHYTNYLRATIARGDYGKSLAALLPCFWIYQNVGQHIFDRSVDQNPYADWINTYASQEFSKSVESMIEMTNGALGNKNAHNQEEAIHAFEISAVFEYQFWDDAYHEREHDIRQIADIK